MNNSGPTAQIIEREGWKASLDFVGHRKAVTVVVSQSVPVTPDFQSGQMKNALGPVLYSSGQDRVTDGIVKYKRNKSSTKMYKPF